ncbi:MAG: hypothetical protein WAL63_20180 [Solirubrobacteraceae bacterium]
MNDAAEMLGAAPPLLLDALDVVAALDDELDVFDELPQAATLTLAATAIAPRANLLLSKCISISPPP